MSVSGRLLSIVLDCGLLPVGGFHLRGLGPRATLILLNGQRQAPGSAPGGKDSFQVDVNSLVPAIMVQRVEVLKDGASAMYGSDAVAGVVNFITRKSFDGVMVDANVGMLQHSGAKNSKIGVLFGTRSDRLSIVGAIEHNTNDEVQTRDIFDQARIDRFGQPSAFADPATYTVNGVRRPDQPGAPVGDTAYLPGVGDNHRDLHALFETRLPDARRRSRPGGIRTGIVTQRRGVSKVV